MIGAAQDPAQSEDPSLCVAPTSWPGLKRSHVTVAPRSVGWAIQGDPGRIATVSLRAGPVTTENPAGGFARTPTPLRAGCALLAIVLVAFSVTANHERGENVKIR